MRRTLLAVTAAAVLVAAYASPASAARKARTTTTTPQWAPAATATVHPGVMTFTIGEDGGGQCTANFVFTNGTKAYLGQAAHCSGTGGATETDGCDSGSLPLGTTVEVEGSDGTTYAGTMVYNSWLAMQAAKKAGENPGEETCDYNDFALIELPAAAVAVTNPSVPFFGGPIGLGAGTISGDSVYSYGNSSLRLGISQLSPKEGISLGDSPDGWSTDVYTVTPGIPGDSGSGFLDSSGRAFGTLSTVAIAPFAGSNGVGNLAKELAYAQSHGFGGVSLVPGTEVFSS